MKDLSVDILDMAWNQMLQNWMFLSVNWGVLWSKRTDWTCFISEIVFLLLNRAESESDVLKKIIPESMSHNIHSIYSGSNGV